MPVNPAFFVPAVPDDEQESRYVQWAEQFRVPVPSLERRVYSITWVHNSTDQWVVTVGECLTGRRTITEGRGSRKRERTIAINDPARVLAIYPGVPYVVKTDSGASVNSRTSWENPFAAGNPSRVEYFSK